MDVQFCPDCVSRGIDCPLMLDGECIHCGRHDAPITHRIADYEYRLRFAWDSFRFRLGVTSARLRARSAVARLLAFRR
ncbi:MAG: hypothetical protein M8354_11430 [Halalkalicoccus sp.]|nr:hypothetical protein [Halalkalicoccus sp.]